MNSEPCKYCKKCRNIKPISEFSPDKRNKDGLQTICKVCSNENNKKYYAKHPEKCRKRTAEWAALHPERVKEYKKAWRARRSQHVFEYNKNWKTNNREKVNMHTRNQRARKYKAPGNGITAEEWKNICEKYGNRCLACGKIGKLTLDHVMPISKGGLHESSNVQPLCRTCNAKKGTKTIDYRQVQLEKVGGEYANE